MLADRVSVAVLGMDEKLRRGDALGQSLIGALKTAQMPHGLTIGARGSQPSPVASTPVVDALEGMPLAAELELADVNETLSENAAIQMATQRVAAVLPLVKGRSPLPGPAIR
jgi:hypothetical protein